MCTKTYSAINEIPNAFEPLFSDAAKQSIFFSLPWFKVLAENVFFGDQIKIFCVESESSNAPLAALVCCERKEEQRWIRKVSGLENYYTSLYAPILESYDNPSKKVLDRLIAETQATSKKWDVMDLKPLPHSGVLFSSLETALKNNGYATEPYFCFGNWYLEVQNRTFNEYLNSLPSKLKNTVKRKKNRLNKNHEYYIDLISSPGEKLEKAIADYTEIYNKSWKKNEPYENFIPCFLRVCAEHRWLRLGILYLDNTPAAAQIWTICNGNAYIYKLAYDESYSQYSVGSILTMEIMKHIIDTDKAREIDYLTGDMPYKEDWMSHRRERWGIIAYNRKTIKGRILYAVSAIKSHLKICLLKLKKHFKH